MAQYLSAFGERRRARRRRASDGHSSPRSQASAIGSRKQRIRDLHHPVDVAGGSIAPAARSVRSLACGAPRFAASSARTPRRARREGASCGAQVAGVADRRAAATAAPTVAPSAAARTASGGSDQRAQRAVEAPLVRELAAGGPPPAGCGHRRRRARARAAPRAAASSRAAQREAQPVAGHRIDEAGRVAGEQQAGHAAGRGLDRQRPETLDAASRAARRRSGRPARIGPQSVCSSSASGRRRARAGRR